MSNGKQLEHVISLIEETLKDISTTEILRNHRLINTSGNSREFDVVIQTVVNGYELIIVIECKDHKKPVAVKEIEAFNSKCSRIPAINKKIFVSRKGYQREAISAAEDFGIELFEADKLNSEQVSNWFPIKQLKLVRYTKYEDIVVYCDSDIDLSETIENGPGVTVEISFDDGTRYLIHEALDLAVIKQLNGLWNIALIHWLRAEENERYKIIPVPFEIHYNRSAKLEIGDNKVVSINGIKATTFIQLTEESASIIDARELVDLSGNIKAKSIEVDFGIHGKNNIILSKDKKSFFAQDPNGEIHQLKSLFIYDPKTDTFQETKE